MAASGEEQIVTAADYVEHLEELESEALAVRTI